MQKIIFWGNAYAQKLLKSIKAGSSFILVLAMIFCSIHSVFAAENGGSAYLGGNEDFMSGALPGPGFYPIVYAFHYTADELMDSNGDKVPVDFDLDVTGTTFRFIYVSDMTLFGASVGWHAIIPVLDTEFNDASTTGLGDIEVSAMILGWHLSKNFHLIGALDIWLPVGEYSVDDPAKIGRNYWTVAPVIAPTYISNTGFEISAKLQYLINFENSDTDYTTGHEFICDYTVGQHFGRWMFGLNGMLYLQSTDDEDSGDDIGNKGKAFSIGPAIQYNYKNMFFNAKVQFDTNVENRPKGEKFWFKFMYAF
ncbi:SphA family protein [Desulfobacter latus]|uniref:Transporter n=1 Tax=Desulfobacter latus TaxID=2292 RepID=A0A850T4P6_9BACT|nr:transporter [Desulfobacter latus]NWH04242.1 transporter [Desulfobacter latus]